MKNCWRIAWPIVLTGLAISAVFAQRAFREYPSVEYGTEIPLPLDWRTPGEWTFARLMYPRGPLDGYRGRFDGPWQEGLSLWTQDYPSEDSTPVLPADSDHGTRLDIGFEFQALL